MDRQGPGVRERGTRVRAGESLRDQREPGQRQDEGGLAQKQRMLKEKCWESTHSSGDRAWERTFSPLFFFFQQREGDAEQEGEREKEKIKKKRGKKRTKDGKTL